MPAKSMLTAAICFAGVAGIVGATVVDESTAVLNSDYFHGRQRAVFGSLYSFSSRRAASAVHPVW